MTAADLLRLIHPALAATVVLPLIGIVSYFAWETRQRRLKTAAGHKTKIPPGVGPEHAKLGRILTGAVVGIALLGIGHPVIKTLIKNDTWADHPFQVIFIGLIGLATLASLVMLYSAKANDPLWRAIFAGLSSAGVVILGFQEGVFRRDSEWYVSHFYFGITVTILMIISLAVLPEIYKDRSQRWRRIHALLNTVALLLFIGQGMTGVRDLLEIPLTWQEPFIYQCDFANQTCDNLITSGIQTSEGALISAQAQPQFQGGR